MVEKEKEGVGILPITSPLCYFFSSLGREMYFTCTILHKGRWKFYAEEEGVYSDNYTDLHILSLHRLL